MLKYWQLTAILQHHISKEARCEQSRFQVCVHRATVVLPKLGKKEREGEWQREKERGTGGWI